MWNDNSSDESGFKIERKTGGGSYVQLVYVGSNVTNFQNESLSASTTYTYRVRAVNSYGNSNYSNEASATTLFEVESLWSEGSGDNIYRMAGNVGIGTSAPEAKLTVAGEIHAREIQVLTAAGADFVFEPDYKLMPLNVLEKHILDKKHLPGILPAEEMIGSGVEVGDMQIMLLQKIEELTLYIIDLKNQNERINDQVKMLQDEINVMNDARHE